jgi:hypothetical protein
MEVYVVTNVAAGWDCVSGVFLSLESLKDFFSERIEEIQDMTVLDFKRLTLEKLEIIVSDTDYVIHEKDAI